jgi:5-deoxy-glucuronate isomerase
VSDKLRCVDNPHNDKLEFVGHEGSSPTVREGRKYERMTMSTQMQETNTQLIFRHTNSRKGRNISITPENSAMKHLVYGRIILDAEKPNERFSTGPLETGLICLSGECTVEADGQANNLSQYDSIYVPRDTEVVITTDSLVDLVECSAEVEKKYPLQIVRYADVEKDSSLKFKTGGASNSRTVNITLGKNVEAGRILAGFTTSEPGHWTSWPPHEHASMLEELYVYYDMPAPAFGVQFVYTNPDEPEFIGVVRDGDAVIMPKGFHPNVSVPGHPINFVWLMAAHREVEDRQFGVVTVQPGFDQGGSGLEASRK